MTKPIVLVLVSLFAVACTTNTVQSSGDERPSVGEALQDFVPHICANQARCDPKGFAKAYSDESDCEMKVTIAFENMNSSGASVDACTRNQINTCLTDQDAAECPADGSIPSPPSCKGC